MTTIRAGGVKGPASATDNAFARYDATTGKLIQNSGVICDDNDNISGVGTLAADGAVTITLATEFATPFQAISTHDGAGEGPIIIFRRSSASPADGDQLASFGFYGKNDAAEDISYATIGSRIVTVTDGAEAGRIDFFTRVAGANGVRAYVQHGIVVGSATGGDKGAGTVNAVGVYDDNTLLTCMALSKEFLASGIVDLDEWDARVPDIVIPAERKTIHVEEEQEVETVFSRTDPSDGSIIVEKVRRMEMRPAYELTPVYDKDGNGLDAIMAPVTQTIDVPEQVIERVHGTARVFKAMCDGGFDPRDPEKFFSRMNADEALPGMPTKVEWVHNRLGMGEIFSRQWLALEMLAVVANAMWLKLKDHDARLGALESSSRIR